MPQGLLGERRSTAGAPLKTPALLLREIRRVVVGGIDELHHLRETGVVMVDLRSGKLPWHLRIHLVKTENIQKLLQTACFALNSLQFFLLFQDVSSNLLPRQRSKDPPPPLP